MDDIDVIRTCYDYFKSISGMDKFKDIPIPQTNYQNNLKELSRSPIELWLESFTRDNNDKDEVELLGNEIYELFTSWCCNNGIDYKISSLKLGVKLTNMNIHGLSKGKHTNKGDCKKFNITELNKYFNIGCIVTY